MLVSRYKIELPHGPEFATGTIEEERKVVGYQIRFHFDVGLALLYSSNLIGSDSSCRPLRVPLVFRRR